MTIEWKKLIYVLLYITVNKVGDHLDQYPRDYSCPCYCNVKHEHIGRENDRCKQTFQMVIQDSSDVYIVYNDELYRVDSLSYSDSSEALSLRAISLTK